MSYNEIPNILVDSVVLPHKPLSSLEIIDTAKKLSLYGFRGDIFERHSSYKNKIKRMWYLKSSGNGTHWVMWFKKGISIVMECNPPVS